MSPSILPSQHRSRILLLASAVLAAGGIALVRFVDEAKPATPASTAARTQAADEPVSDGNRYQIPVTRTQPARGPDTASATVVVWSDLERADKGIEPVLAALLQAYGEDMRVVFRHHLPVEHAARLPLHELARMAHDQAGKFWELRALVLKDDVQVPTPRDLERYATAVGLDWAVASAALERHAYQRHIVADGIFGSQFGVNEAPTLFVNGRRFLGAPTIPRLRRLIDEEIASAKRLLAAGTAPAALYTELTKDALWRIDQTASAAPMGPNASLPN